MQYNILIEGVFDLFFGDLQLNKIRWNYGSSPKTFNLIFLSHLLYKKAIINERSSVDKTDFN